MASRRTTSLLQIILQWICEHFIYKDIVFFYRFLRSALVADYFTWDTLALSIIRSPTTHPYLRRYNFSRYNSAGVDTRHFGDYWFRKSPSLQIMVSLAYPHQNGFARRNSPLTSPPARIVRVVKLSGGCSSPHKVFGTLWGPRLALTSRTCLCNRP